MIHIWPRATSSSARIRILILLALAHGMGCFHAEMASTRMNLVDTSQIRWNAWAAKHSIGRRSLASSGRTEASLNTTRANSKDPATVSFAYDVGYNYPTISIHDRSLQYRFPLHPLVKKFRGLGVSRISISPSHERIGVLIQVPTLQHDILTIVDGRSGELLFFDENVYDMVWGPTDDSFVFTRVIEGLPAQVWLSKAEKQALVATSHSSHESLLLHRTSNGAVFLARSAPGAISKLEVISGMAPIFPVAALQTMEASAVAFTKEGFFELSYAHNQFGDVFQTHTDGKRVRIFTGSKEKAAISLKEVTHSVASVALGTGHGMDALYIGREVQEINAHPPYQRIEIAQAGDAVHALLDGPACPAVVAYKCDTYGCIAHPSVNGTCENLLRAEHLQLPSTFNVKIPATILYPKTKPRGTIVFAYGAYGTPLAVEYSQRISFFLSQSFAVLLCHARGGGEFGPAWYHAGAGAKKQATIDDIRTCASYLGDHSELMGHPRIGYAHSAGGLNLLEASKQDGVAFDALFLDAPLTSAHSESDSLLPRLAAREALEWGSLYSERRQNGPTMCQKIAVIVRLQDAIINPLETLTWTESERTTSTCPEWFVVYPVPGKGHSHPLSNAEESAAQEMWSIFIDSLVP